MKSKFQAVQLVCDTFLEVEVERKAVVKATSTKIDFYIHRTFRHVVYKMQVVPRVCLGLSQMHHSTTIWIMHIRFVSTSSMHDTSNNIVARDLMINTRACWNH